MCCIFFSVDDFIIWMNGGADLSLYGHLISLINSYGECIFAYGVRILILIRFAGQVTKEQSRSFILL